ncbi:MAG: hypothetical protein KKA19_07065, partial [Candidatus Margulisbacteria bacterium]|nr:hypothetical protein [Candidatus Margulisiibacteriota bacterium]
MYGKLIASTELIKAENDVEKIFKDKETHYLSQNNIIRILQNFSKILMGKEVHIYFASNITNVFYDKK